METVTLLFFVLMLLVAALILTQTIRRDLATHGRNEVGTRRGPAHRLHTQRNAHSTPPPLRHTHKSPPRHL